MEQKKLQFSSNLETDINLFYSARLLPSIFGQVFTMTSKSSSTSYHRSIGFPGVLGWPEPWGERNQGAIPLGGRYIKPPWLLLLSMFLRASFLKGMLKLQSNILTMCAKEWPMISILWDVQKHSLQFREYHGKQLHHCSLNSGFDLQKKLATICHLNQFFLSSTLTSQNPHWFQSFKGKGMDAFGSFWIHEMDTPKCRSPKISQPSYHLCLRRLQRCVWFISGLKNGATTNKKNMAFPCWKPLATCFLCVVPTKSKHDPNWWSPSISKSAESWCSQLHVNFKRSRSSGLCQQKRINMEFSWLFYDIFCNNFYIRMWQVLASKGITLFLVKSSTKRNISKSFNRCTSLGGSGGSLEGSLDSWPICSNKLTRTVSLQGHDGLASACCNQTAKVVSLILIPKSPNLH